MIVLFALLFVTAGTILGLLVMAVTETTAMIVYAVVLVTLLATNYFLPPPRSPLE
jgi:hypothetical protein